MQKRNNVKKPVTGCKSSTINNLILKLLMKRPQKGATLDEIMNYLNDNGRSITRNHARVTVFYMKKKGLIKDKMRPTKKTITLKESVWTFWKNK